jgi:D-alanyl-D-alanine dipeptidase
MRNKLRNHLLPSRLLLFIFSTVIVSNLAAQDSSYTRPPVVSSWKEYRDQVEVDPSRKMVELRSLIPGLVYDLRYATTNNFMQRLMYPTGTNITFLRAPVAAALKKVQDELSGNGYGLKIFDAYRPYAVTVKFWELVKDERYVANPSKGSGHNRGIAVDLTIINKSTGAELDMGTGFDNFTDTAHADYKNLTEQVLQNRALLRTLMEKNGFKILDTEWWHFYFVITPPFEILDIDFRKLKKRL